MSRRLVGENFFAFRGRMVFDRQSLSSVRCCFRMSRAERQTEHLINGRMASADGPIRTFPLMGIKGSPPHLHDRRLLTLEDTVEFFNMIQGLKLTADEKKALVALMSALKHSSGSLIPLRVLVETVRSLQVRTASNG